MEDILTQARKFIQSGQLEQAKPLYVELHKTDPHNPATVYNLGVLHQKTNDIANATICLKKAIELKPDYFQAHNTLGTVYQSNNQIADAKLCYENAIRIKPDHAFSLNNLGSICLTENLYENAVSYFEQALKTEPNYPNALCNLGRAYIFLRKISAAGSVLEKAIALAPTYTDALFFYGSVLQEQGKIDKAIEHYMSALSHQPNHLRALYNLATAYVAIENPNKALNVYDTLLSLTPHNTDALRNIANIHIKECENGSMDLAIKSLTSLLKITPQDQLADLTKHSLGNVIWENEEELLHWRKETQARIEKMQSIDLKHYISNLADNHATPFYYLAYQGYDNIELKKAYAKIFKTDEMKCPANNRKKKKIAFICQGSVGVFLMIMARVLSLFDSTKFAINIVAPYKELDRLQASIHNDAINYIPITSNLGADIKQLQAQKFDLAYFWEVGSSPLNYFLPFFRIAPVQCTSWGSFDTSGIPQVDYFISSKLQEHKNSQNHYTEKLITLDNLPEVFTPPKQPNTSLTKKDFGLSDDLNCYLCPQSLAKISPDFESILAEILRQDANGHIYLIEHQINKSWGAALKRRFDNNIKDVAERITILPSLPIENYYQLLHCSDILLDTTLFGGGITTLEATYFGLPIVTLPGEFMRGRFTYACYKKMDINQCIANSSQDYVKRAIKFASDKAYHDKISQKIFKNRDIVCNNEDFVTELEDCFLALINKE